MKFKKYLLLIAGMLPAGLFFFAAANSLAGYEPQQTISTESKLPEGFENTLASYDEVISSLNRSINDLQSQNLILESENNTLKTAPTSSTISEEDEIEDIEYTDGTYTGTGKGFAGKVKVEVLIKDKKIASIKILSHSDDESFMSKAANLIPSIIERQSTKVDTISGATYSSKGILRAVNKALLKAEGEEIEEETETQITVGKGSFPFADGVYQGIGKGFKGNIKLELTIKNSTITAIKILSTNDDNSYFTKASTIIDLVLANQTLNVDTVSGATYSSKGIKAALADSMKTAAMETYSLVEKTESTEKPNQDTPLDPPTPCQYADGIYHGQAVCYSQDGTSFDDYNVDLQLTISLGKITDISATTTADEYSNSWFMDAFNGYNNDDGIRVKILSLSDYSSIDSIDAVSGATCSSDAIKTAAKDALNKAKAGNTNE